MTKTLSLSLFSCYRSELMGIAMIGVLIAYFIGLGGLYLARMVCNLHWHRQNSHISFGSICGTNFIQSSEKRGICFARRCGYCVDSHIILKRDMALWYIIVWHG